MNKNDCFTVINNNYAYLSVIAFIVIICVLSMQMISFILVIFLYRKVRLAEIEHKAAKYGNQDQYSNEGEFLNDTGQSLFVG